MDPSAATSHDAGLASFFLDAVRLGGDPSPGRERYLAEMLQRQQQRHAALAPLPSREQPDQNYGATTLRHAALASPAAAAAFQVRMMQELQITRQFWPHPQHYYPYASQIGSSSRAGYASLIVGAASNAFGSSYSGPAQSGSQHQSGPSSSQQQQQQPCTLSASAGQYEPQALVTASQYQQSGGNAPDYGSSFYQRLRAIQAAQAQAMPSMERRCQTLEETRSELLRGIPMELQLVTFPDSAANVVHLLLHKDAEDYEQIRQSVLAGVTRRVHDFIDNKEGHQVLVALLRTCANRHAEVDAIVQAAVSPNPNPNGKHRLLRQTKDEYWVNCVKELMTAASPYPDLCAMLVDRLLCEGLLENDRGDHLLHHCFATTSCQDAVIVVQCALDKIDSMLETSSGSKCLVECYDKARGQQLRAFHDKLITRAFKVATGKFSNYFMQHVLEHSDGETRKLLVDRLMADVVPLSLHPIGSYVVEACYQKAGLLPRVLAAFLRLDKAYLVQLVQGMYANYVVHKLLDTAMNSFPRETIALARRIDGLLPQIKDKTYTKTVVTVVRKLLTRYGRMYS